MIKILSLFFCSLFFIEPLFAGVSDKRRKTSTALFVENNSFLFELTPTNANSGQIKYVPNKASVYGLELTAFGFTIALTKTAALSSAEEAAKGNTTYDDVRGSLNFGSHQEWLVTGFYNRYNGLYIENSDQLPNLTGGAGYIIRGDMTILNTGGGVIYVFQPEKFSIAAALFQSARQTESGGSFLTFAGADTFEFSGASALIPSGSQSLYGDDALITKGKITTIGTAAGYGYTLTVRSYFVTLMGLFGGGNQWREYTVNEVEKSSNSATSKLLYGYSLGYNGENFYAGLSGFSSSNSYSTNNIRFDVAVTSSRLFVGYRF